jgi:aminomethyltransferase
MTRIEAGLVLINVEFHSSRFAFTDHDRVTPKELGFGWMLKGIDADDRPFIGRNAIRRELADGTSRWASVGLLVDWQAYNRLYEEAGLIPPKDETPLDYESMLYDDDGNRVGYATSLMYSPMLQRHIAMARVHPQFGPAGSRVNVELTINHQYMTVPADTARLPLFNPPRKTA